MLPSPQIIKKTAKNQLRNSWVSAMVISAILMLTASFFGVFLSTLYPLLTGLYKTSAVIGLIVYVGCLLALFLTVLPLFQGVLRWFWFLGLEKQLSLGEIFYYFSDTKLFFNTLSFYLLLYLRCILTIILCSLPSIAVRFLPRVASEFLPNLNSYSNFLQSVSDFLLLVGLAVAVVVLMKFFCAPIIIIIEENAEPKVALSIAKNLRISKKSCLVFIFSFVGWFFLSFLGITLIYTIPYFIMSYAVAVRFSITNHRYLMSRQGIDPII